MKVSRTTMSNWLKRVGWVLAYLFAAGVSRAQQLDDAAGITSLYDSYRNAVYWIAGALILFLIGAALVRRAQRRTLNEESLPFNFNDLTELEKRGKLTPEEAKKVRDALIRQATQRAKTTPAGLKGADALLQDEEVRRLEALAMAKRLSEETTKRAEPEQSPRTAEEIPPELREAVAKGLLSVEEARAIAERSRKKQNPTRN
jgi:polyhydroxyalkanoate synthesis regulator phasin